MKQQKTAKQRIKEALLKHRVLTTAMGFQEFGTNDFRKVISELREEGLPIKSKRKVDSACYNYWIEEADLPPVEKKSFWSWLGVDWGIAN